MKLVSRKQLILIKAQKYFNDKYFLPISIKELEKTIQKQFNCPELRVRWEENPVNINFGFTVYYETTN